MELAELSALDGTTLSLGVGSEMLGSSSSPITKCMCVAFGNI